jgi:peptidyl-prolyl cis-trans isomerase B (cyclophilin B)
MNKFQLFFVLASVFVTSCSSPLALFTTDQQAYKTPAKVQCTNQSKNTDKYEWNFGDGTTSSEKDPQHLYTKAGTYEIVLNASKKNKTVITKKSITVTEPAETFVEIETTAGNIIIRLYNDTPLHKANFIKLVSEGFYDGTLFHRCIPDFMIQGGDPNSKNAQPGQALGMGGPGYQIPAEFNPHHYHIKGALAAARTGDQMNPKRESSGSQFYLVIGTPVSEGMLDRIQVSNKISYTPEQREAYTTKGGTPFLDGAYTVFGEVVEGLDVMEKIVSGPRNQQDRPQKDVSMKMKFINK